MVEFIVNISTRFYIEYTTFIIYVVTMNNHVVVCAMLKHKTPVLLLPMLLTQHHKTILVRTIKIGNIEFINKCKALTIPIS